jgi:hypothetical protein
MAFAFVEKLGSPLSPCGVNMTTLQDSRYGTDCRFAPPYMEGYSASPPPVARKQREPATWLSGDYHGRTFTGELTAPSRRTSILLRQEIMTETPNQLNLFGS